jgi:iron complex transport system substrate-binding protein
LQEDYVIRRARLFFPAFLASLLWLAGLAESGAQPGYPLTALDDTGSLLLVPRRPQRIVSLTMFSDEVLLELVGPQRLLAVTSFAADAAVSNISQRIAGIRHRLGMHAEVILSLRPDLVVVANWSDAGAVAQLRAAGLPVYLSSSATSVQEVRDRIRAMARVVGEERAGEELIVHLDARLSDLDRRLAAVPEGRRLTVLDWSAWGVAMGRGSSWDEVVFRAGLRNAAAGLPVDGWGQVPLSKEKLIELDPDLLVLPGWVYGQEQGAQAFYDRVAGDPALRGLKALRNRRLVRMPENLRAATSQYIVDAVEFLARAAYPELWGER